MLRLVHPAPAGNGTAPSRRHYPSPLLFLTDDEASHVRAAIRGAARTFGSLTRLAEALGVTPSVLTRKRRPHPGLALAVARLTGLSLDAMLAGRLTEVGVCPSCGARRGGGAS